MRVQAGFTPHVNHIKGSGDRIALALHCTMAWGGAWKGLAAALGGELQFVAPDMPSHGQSADWDEVSSFADTVYQSALDNLQPGADLIGHSFGGVIALRLALARPQDVRSLTLIEPVFFAVALEDAPDTMQDSDGQAKALFDAFAAGDYENAARLFNRMWSNSPPWKTLPPQLRAAMTRAVHVVPDTGPFLNDDIEQMLAGDRLQSLSVPTLLVRGAETLPAVCAVNDGLERRLPDAVQAVIPGAGHMVSITHPVQVAAAMRPLLEGS